MRKRLHWCTTNSVGTINRLIGVCQAGNCSAVAGTSFSGLGWGTGTDCNTDNGERARLHKSCYTSKCLSTKWSAKMAQQRENCRALSLHSVQRVEHTRLIVYLPRRGRIASG